MPLDLDSPYQISKVVGEFYSVYYHRQHGLPTVRARFQNIYGPREILGAGRWRGTPATVWRNVTPTFVYRSLKGMPLLLDNGGQASRDFVYVGDIVRRAPALRARRRAGRRLQPRKRRRDVDPRAGRDDRPHDRQRRRRSRSSRRGTGIVRASASGAPRRHGGARLRGRGRRSKTASRRTIDWMREHMELIDRCIARHAHRLDEAVAPQASVA